MRIELTGAPTAGKSTLVRSLVREGMRMGKNINLNKIPPHWDFFANIIRDIYKVYDFPKLFNKTLKALAASWVADILPQPIVFDEHIILCGFSLAVRRPELAMRYFENVPLPKLLIFLSPSKQILMERNEARGERSHIDKTNRCIKAHEEYIPLLRKRGCNILILDSGLFSTAELTKKVLVKILKDAT